MNRLAIIAACIGGLLLLVGLIVVGEGTRVLPPIFPYNYAGEARWTGLGIAVILSSLLTFYLMVRVARRPQV